MNINNQLMNFNVKIADESIKVISTHRSLILKVNDNHKRFIVPIEKSGTIIRVHYNTIPSLNLGKLIFDSGNWWRIYNNEENYIIQILSAVSPTDFQPIRLAVFDSEFKNGDLYILSDSNPAENSYEYPNVVNPSKSINPLNPALDMILMLNILPKKNGVILHGCGVIDSDKGILFCGRSGSGKSTLANIWKKNAVILGDERVIIRRIEDRFWIYGTPWHKDMKVCSPQKIPLERIYIIEHAAVNQINLLQRTEAISKLLVRCFPPFYNRESMENILSFFDQLTRDVPCYELGFVPNEDIVNFVRGLY